MSQLFQSCDKNGTDSSPRVAKRNPGLKFANAVGVTENLFKYNQNLRAWYAEYRDLDHDEFWSDEGLSCELAS